MTAFVKIGSYIRTFLTWSILGILLGVLGGSIGAGFHHALHFVTHLRETNFWLIYLLPIGGLLSVSVYHLFKLQENRGTNEIIDAILHARPVKILVAPAIFIATCITHLLGGSAGREGAALQLGGSTASMLGRILKLSENEQKALVTAGMSAVFAGLFGTALTACLFSLEFVYVGTILSPALLPSFLAAYCASRVSSFFGVHAETYILDNLTVITTANMWKFLILAICISILGIVMCKFFHQAEHLAKKHLPNTWIRISVGGIIIICMTLLVGDQRYNGAGMNMALAAIGGQADWYDFLLKILFTAITLAAGFKGGEIVPTFCIGATFGCIAGSVLGLDLSICAALGLIDLFCCATNSPIASIVLSIEMFGSTNLYLFALICVITFVLSGHSGLYGSQVIHFPKHTLKG